MNATPTSPTKQTIPTSPIRLLLVDDDRANLESLVRIFAKEGVAALAVTNGVDALAMIRQHPIEVLVTDLMMPGMTGSELLRAVKAVRPEVEVIFITAYGTVEAAVAAMKEGAYDFITKPPKRHDILKVVRQAFERSGLMAENRALKASLAELTGGGGKAIVGQSPAFRRVMEMMQLAAPSTATILLLGESGTGKELFARAVHEHSARAKGPFIPINCGAIPDTLLESELFGYEKGAFTGAIARKEGRFERASGGTLFLDEVGELSPAVQVKLLRVLQEGEIERLGGSGPIPVDVRIVAGTNRDLKKRVEEGHFREDLFYRLNVVPITLPPLRERREDIPLLTRAFVRQFNQKHGTSVTGVSASALDVLSRHTWPGNVRELRNFVERAVILAREGELSRSHFPEGIAREVGDESSETRTPAPLVLPPDVTAAEAERILIMETLRQTGQNKAAAARKLGMDVKTIRNKLKQYGLSTSGEGAD